MFVKYSVVKVGQQYKIKAERINADYYHYLEKVYNNKTKEYAEKLCAILNEEVNKQVGYYVY